MDRQIVYPGSIPLDTDLLRAQRSTMIALGYLTQMILGSTTVVDGLACTPTSPSSLSINIGPGSITQLGAIDTTMYGSLPALAANPLVRIGINTGSVGFTLTPPVASGQVINYLIEASLAEQDINATVLPYYNASNPAQPFSGPMNGGAAQATQRVQTVQLALKPGPSVAAGGQNLPAVDAGWVGLYVITVGFGQTAITAANITTLPTAPFLNWKLPQLTPGTHNLVVFQPTTQGVWTVPSGVSAVRLRIWGGGGAGGNGFAGAGGGGAGGGYSEGYLGVTPGQSFTVTVGNGGAGTGAGSVGGASSFGSAASATGGVAGASGSSNAAGQGGATGGAGYGLGLSIPGSAGGDALNIVSNTWLSGTGGGSHGSVGGLAVTGSASGQVAGRNGAGPGSGAAGGIGGGIGGQGGPGLVLLEW